MQIVRSRKRKMFRLFGKKKANRMFEGVTCCRELFVSKSKLQKFFVFFCFIGIFFISILFLLCSRIRLVNIAILLGLYYKPCPKKFPVPIHNNDKDPKH